jgi:Tol biopolymer transport system component
VKYSKLIAGTAIAALVGGSTMLPAPSADAALILTGTRLVLGAAGAEPDGEIVEASMTPDRGWLAFSSDATNLVPNDTNDSSDVFVQNRATGAVTRIVGLDGTESDSNSYGPSICADGSKVAFTTDTDLWDVDFDTNGSSDVYIWDRDTDDDAVLDEAGATSLYRIGVDPFGIEADFGTYSAAISADCNWVAFVTADPLIGASDGNDADDVYVRHTDPAEEHIVRISTGASPSGGGGLLPAISANGRHVVYGSFASDIAAGSDGFKFGYYLRDRDADADGNYDEGGSGRTDEYVSKSSTGVVSTGGPDLSYPPSISADGRCVAFRFYNGFTLDPPSSSTAADAVYLRDRTAGTTTLVSKNSLGLAALDTLRPAVSPSCRYITFDVQDGFFITKNPSTGRDVFVRDMTAGTLDVISVSGDGTPQFSTSQSTQVFDDGAALVVSGNARVAGAAGGNGARDAFLITSTVDTSDSVAPTGATLTGITSRWSLKPALALRWRASDNAGAPTITVSRRTVDAAGKVSAWSTYSTGTSPLSAAPKLSAFGQTQCFKAQARDLAGNTGPRLITCTSLPLTSKGLTYSSGWKTTKISKAYGGQLVSSRTKNASMTRKGLKGQRIALVVTTCKGCGTVNVYWNNKLVKKNVNLGATSTKYQQVIEVASFSRPTAGTLKVVVTSSGKPVQLEGIGVHTPLS